jgi:hypothetical protein
MEALKSEAFKSLLSGLSLKAQCEPYSGIGARFKEFGRVSAEILRISETAWTV